MGTPLRASQIRTEQQVESATRNLALPIAFVDTFAKLATTPSVQNVENWITQNTVPVTITNFLNGQPGQEIHILGDGQTTIKNNANIVTNTGADKLLAANKYYTFKLFSTVWIEHS